MIDFNKPKSFSVQMSDGKVMQVYREELMQDPNLRNIITSFDKLLEEIVEVEYRKEVLIHAHRSMKSKMEGALVEYLEKKHGLVSDKGDNDEA
jgi:hypothetical protein